MRACRLDLNYTGFSKTTGSPDNACLESAGAGAGAGAGYGAFVGGVGAIPGAIVGGIGGAFSCVFGLNSCGNCSVDMYVPDDPVNISTSVSGQYKINSTDPWVASYYALSRNNNIEFYAMEIDKPRCVFDLSDNDFLPPLVEEDRDYLLPTLSFRLD